MQRVARFQKGGELRSRPSAIEISPIRPTVQITELASILSKEIGQGCPCLSTLTPITPDPNVYTPSLKQYASYLSR